MAVTATATQFALLTVVMIADGHGPSIAAASAAQDAGEQGRGGAPIETSDTRLAELRRQSTELGSCQPAESDLLIADVAMWTAAEDREIASTFERGEAAAAACAVGSATTAWQELEESEQQLGEMSTALGSLPVTDADPRLAEGPLQLAEWLAQLDAAAADEAPASRLARIRAEALPLVQRVMACQLQQYGALVATRVRRTAERAHDRAAVLRRVIEAQSTCERKLTATQPVNAGALLGPSWLPPSPAAAAAAKVTNVAVPEWVPGRDSPAAQPSVRASDLVGQSRERLIQEEQRHIDDTLRAEAQTRNARAQAEADGQARAASAARAAIDQAESRRVVEDQRRAERRTSFAGLLGRVAATAGAVGATVLAPPLGLSALVPAITAVRAATSAAPSLSANAPAIAATASAVATSRAAATLTAGSGPAPAGVASMAGGTSLAETIDEYAGTWRCSVTTLGVDVDGSRTSERQQTTLVFEPSGPGSYQVASGIVGSGVARLSGRALVWHESVREDQRACQQEMSVQRDGWQLRGRGATRCADGVRLNQTLECSK